MAATVRFQAERKAGEFLGEIEVPKGNRYTGSMLADLGLTEKESHRFQLLAGLPPHQLHHVGLDVLGTMDGLVD